MSGTAVIETVDVSRLHDFARRALCAVDVPEPHARMAANAMAWSNLRGLDRFGVSGRLDQLVARVESGGSAAAPLLDVDDAASAFGVIDGKNLLGQVGGVVAMRAAIARARKFGVGLVTMRDIGSLAALGYYPSLAIEEQMIGITITNSPPLIAAPGGTTRILGNQPHAIGCPADQRCPILFDSATTEMSTGEIEHYLARGEPLPDGVLRDEEGLPTRDPARWLTGSLEPIGGYRGFGLALAFELLTGVLAGGARFGDEVAWPSEVDTPTDVSVCCVAIDPARSMPYDEFVRRVDQLIDLVGASGRPGAGRPHVPGERGFRLAEQRSRDGIPLSSEDVGRLRRLCDELKVASW